MRGPSSFLFLKTISSVLIRFCCSKTCTDHTFFFFFSSQIITSSSRQTPKNNKLKKLILQSKILAGKSRNSILESAASIFYRITNNIISICPSELKQLNIAEKHFLIVIHPRPFLKFENKTR